MAKYLYNQEAVDNLKLSDTSVLDRLVDYESAREAHSKKEHAKKDKRMTIGEAVATFVQDGDIITDGGFSYVRTPHQAFHDVWIIPTIHTPGRRCAGLTDSMTAL